MDENPAPLPIEIEAVDRGAALARLDPAPKDPVALFALAERSSRAAVLGAARPLRVELHPGEGENRVRYLRSAHATLHAAAAVEMEIVDDFVDALGREGRISALVNVVVIDEDGEPVARASFDWVVLRRS
ncbi:MAG TPA: hypothetical protein VMH02_09010 [Verrucomicrobiae bacterium]|nr:hypothetical protein [Verrucomicrobiae bacterium]